LTRGGGSDPQGLGPFRVTSHIKLCYLKNYRISEVLEAPAPCHFRKTMARIESVEATSYRAITRSPARIQLLRNIFVLLRKASSGEMGVKFSVHCPRGDVPKPVTRAEMSHIPGPVTLQRSSIKLRRSEVGGANKKTHKKNANINAQPVKQKSPT